MSDTTHTRRPSCRVVDWSERGGYSTSNILMSEQYECIRFIHVVNIYKFVTLLVLRRVRVTR